MSGPGLTDAAGEGALRRYRVMAWVVGTGLALLVFVGVPLQLAGHPALVATLGPVHGLLYIVYLATALDLSRRAGSSPLEMLAMGAAGLVPGLAFVVERHVTRRVRAAAPARSRLGRQPRHPRSPDHSCPEVSPP